MTEIRAANDEIIAAEEYELVTTPLMNASPTLVYEAWTNPNIWHSGGVRTGLRTRFTNLICGREEYGSL